MTVDDALLKISKEITSLKQNLPARDTKILISMSKQLKSGMFLTENQAKLAVKILNENIGHIKPVISNITEILLSEKWSKSFRITQKIRKIFIDPKNNEIFNIQFNFNTKLKDKLTKLSSKIRGNFTSIGNIYSLLLTEQNLYLVITTFKNDGFEIDEKLMNFYEEIDKIIKHQENLFDIFSIENKKLKNILENEIGTISKENLLLIHDRKIKYQYQVDDILPKNLVNDIASRKNRNIWAKSDTIEFKEIISSLKKLKRFPVLLIFNGYELNVDLESLKFLENSAKMLDITNIGIYFRYANGERQKEFNNSIAELKYNSMLDENVEIVGLCNSKIPKFLIKDKWKPKSIISFTTNFKNNKISNYNNDVDLIIYYTNHPPLFKDNYEILQTYN